MSRFAALLFQALPDMVVSHDFWLSSTCCCFVGVMNAMLDISHLKHKEVR